MSRLIVTQPMSAITQIAHLCRSSGVELDSIPSAPQKPEWVRVVRQRLQNAIWRWCSDKNRSWRQLETYREAIKLIDLELKNRELREKNRTKNKPSTEQLTFAFFE